MILQKNPRLNKDIQEVGCLFLCLARITEIEYNYEFTQEQLNNIWDLSIKNNFIINREMKKPDNVLMLLKHCILIGGKNIYQVGQTINNITTFWQWVNKDKLIKVYTMAMEKTGGLIGTHFILVNNSNDKIITYDSMNFNRIGKTTNAKRFIYYAVL